VSCTGGLRVGTRGSALALAQAGLVCEALQQHGIDHEVVVVETAGDRRAPDTPWGEGAFVAAIERALLEDRVDLAVHSAKDVPTEEDPRLRICAYLPREEPRDALVLAGSARPTIGRTGLAALPPGALIGTDSPRRTGFLRAHRPDLEVRPLHGNVDTRLRRLDEGRVDALILAAAGLIRLGRADRIGERIPEDIVPPAPGQGAIAIQTRANDTDSSEKVAALDDLPTRRAVEAERTLLRATGGGCRAPIGALASLDGPEMSIVAGFATIDGRASGIEQLSGSPDAATELARELARRLIARRSRFADRGRVLITRRGDGAQRLVARLAEHGIAGIVVPSIEIEILIDDGRLDGLFASPGYEWAVATSANGARAVSQAVARHGSRPSVARWAAVGSVTARELRVAGIAEVWQPGRANAASLAEELPVERAERVLLIRGSLADDELPTRLSARGAEVDEVVVYRTIEAPDSSRAFLSEALENGPIDAVIYASPSAVRGFLGLADRLGRRADVSRLPALSIGPRTSEAVRSAGLAIRGESATPDATAVAELTAELLAGDR
jgi:hydroxymethylbilane synthase